MNTTLKYYSHLSSNLRQHNQSKVDAFFTLKTDENTTNFTTNATKTTE
ncbi:TPA_asm: integrase [Listeria monocytogenes]|nr:integrase [Listeria monocytogenes]